MVTVGLDNHRQRPHVWLPPVGRARPWSRPELLLTPSAGFTFGLLSDRTGLARPGVFQRAIEVLNWLRPDFVVQIGDLIEGYVTDEREISAQWDEVDAILARLDVPLFRVVGNHDVSNEAMRSEWVRRHGLLHYHFRYDDVLFLLLNTSDPPQDLTEFGGKGDHELTPERLAELHALRQSDPDALRKQFEAMADWDSTMPAAISEEQVNYFEGVLAEHRDVRWTVVCMHIPAWQGDGHPALDRLRAALADRPYTMFAGHIHNYRREVIGGRDHIRLGPTGGAWVRTGDRGNFDHVSLVRTGLGEPSIANVVLDGVLGVDGGIYPPRPRPVARHAPTPQHYVRYRDSYERQAMTTIRQLTQFTPDDDLLHDEVSASGLYARESLLLTAPIPDEQLLIFLYAWREGGTKWGRFVFIAGADMNSPLFLSHADDTDYSGENLRDFTVGGLHWRQPKPLTTAEVEFHAGRVELALRFEGIHAPFSWHDNADGCPDWAAHNRFEQSGLTRGSLTLGDRHVEFTGVGHRDHSWGSRNWNMLQHWKWINAATPDGASSLHAMIMWVKGKTLVNGYLNFNGQVSPIVSAEASADLDDNMVHRAARGRFVDEQGREMTFESRYSAGWSMPIQHLLLNEIGMAATLNCAPAVAHVELGWPTDYVRNLAPLHA